MADGLSRAHISADAFARLRQYADAGGSEECCGLLLGRDAQIFETRLADNVASDRTRRFEIDPAVLIAAEREARLGGPAIIGYFHSHPGGSARPSTTDAAMAAPDGRLWLILGGNEMLGWRSQKNGSVHGRFEPVELAID